MPKRRRITYTRFRLPPPAGASRAMNHLFVTLTFIAVLCRSSRQYDQLQYSQTFGPYYPYGVRGYYSNNNYLWPSFATLQPRFYYYHYPRSSVTTAAGTTEPVAETAGTTMTPGTRTTKPVAGTAGTMTTPGTTTTSAETPKPVAGTAGTTAKATRRNLATDSSTTGLTPAKDVRYYRKLRQVIQYIQGVPPGFTRCDISSRVIIEMMELCFLSRASL